MRALLLTLLALSFACGGALPLPCSTSDAGEAVDASVEAPDAGCGADWGFICTPTTVLVCHDGLWTEMTPEWCQQLSNNNDPHHLLCDHYATCEADGGR